jgi:hypothetical protein
MLVISYTEYHHPSHQQRQPLAFFPSFFRLAVDFSLAAPVILDSRQP